MTRSLPVRPSLESDRKRAKSLLKRWRAGEPEALERLREQHPLAKLRGASALDSLEPSLADSQLVVAREYGLQSWPRLKHRIESLTASFDERVAMLVDSACNGDLRRADALLASDPTLATASLATLCVVADAPRALALLEREPALASGKLAPKGWAPIVYACHSRWCSDEPAVASSRAAIVSALLERGADPNAFATAEHSGDPLSALYGALGRNDYREAAELLLKAGAAPDDGESIYHAAERANVDGLTLLLAHGGDVDARTSRHDNRPISFLLGHHQLSAMRPGADEGVRWLLEHGADPNLPSGPNAETAFHRAAASGRGAEMGELLVAHGGAPRLRTQDGRTAYDVAVLHGNAALAGWLEARGEAGARSGAEAFVRACVVGEPEAARAMLADREIRVAALSPEQQASFVATAWRGATSSLALMLELGFAIDTLGADGETALHAAAWTGQLDKVELLLTHAPALEQRCKAFGSTPLGWTCHGSTTCRNPDGDYPGIAKRLLGAGADPHATSNEWGGSLLGNAAHEVADMLRTHGAQD